MIKELADWFSAPVEPHTPDHILDEILEQITTDGSEPVSEDQPARQAKEQPYLIDPINKLAINHHLSHLRNVMRRVNEDAQLKGQIRHLYALAPLTDWAAVQARSKPTFRMLLQELNSEIKAVLEIAQADAYPASENSLWTINLRRYEGAQYVTYFAPWDHLSDAPYSESWPWTPSTHQQGRAVSHQPTDPSFMLLFVDEGMDVTVADLHDIRMQKVRRFHSKQKAEQKEQVLLSVIREVTGQEEVDLNKDLLQLGIDSLSCMEIVQLARERGLKLSASQILERSSVADLADMAQEIEPIGSPGSESALLLSGVSRFARRSAAQPPWINFLIITEGSHEESQLPAALLHDLNIGEESSRMVATQHIASMIASLIK
ncbi:acyl carrier protein [Streptomyces sp. NPDC000349]|uniref:acyl carrier protein n=1 Tax=unclassified Streptomyces TaxID=2593676 RepID=UPI002784A5BC|nr:acyl carrier protein [Streptomyces sp. DSM 40167]MDQ0405298.1 aryl carrier-like protein [Streptomyces sp. DSM 40167]